MKLATLSLPPSSTARKGTAPLASLLALSLAACSTTESPVASSDGAASTQDAHAVHAATLVIDGHLDLLLPKTPQRYYLPDGGKRVTLERFREGGVDAAVFSIAVGAGPDTPEGDAEAQQDADAKLALVRDWITASDGQAALALTAGDVERLRDEGKVAVLLGFQNARILGTDLAAFDRFHAAGVRVAGLTHAGHNAFADSSRPRTDEQAERHGGLSELGKQAVRRFNDLGVLVDVSQLTSAAVKQTLDITRAPVVASHSNVRALIDNTRNLGDDELDAIKANGGVVLVTPFRPYLRKPDAVERARIGELRTRHGLAAEYTMSASEGAETLPEDQRSQLQDALKLAEPAASVADLVDHIDYIVERLGIEHVGIGSDFDHGAGIEGYASPTDAPNVTAELLRRGYSAEQIAAIWGGNLLRVLRAAEQAAAP